MAAKRKASVRKASKSVARSASSKAKVKSKSKRNLKLVTSKPKKTTEKKVAKKAVSSAKPTDDKVARRPGLPKMPKKLLDALERRKNPEGNISRIQQLFSKPPARRGRRPRNPEYNSGGYEEDVSNNEQEIEKLQYDTGIKVSYPVDVESTNMDRNDDFDEELDFG